MIPLREKRALVLFSGGQDSATCLAWALSRYQHVETLGFDYGQRHRVELDCRTRLRTLVADMNPDWAPRLAEDHLLPVDFFRHLGQTAMTDDVAITMQADGLPNTFVPGRNLLFLTLAAALAYRRNLNVLIGGMTEADYSGYPDCRDNTMKALQVALSLGIDRQLTIETPLMWLDKTEIWDLAWRLGGDVLVETIRQESHTCYLGTRDTLHSWGYGCGSCPACTLRARGYVRWAANRLAA
ncbi:7-cyano-7-deazaguanine synthase QueC [Kerstersia gyiorum]|uniref:7-cyano-7-deazaguanine synthase n=1 Tax=Kerstersia gyiorum TaxID=206506 RepID=A0A4Q7MVQ2_9BURK|nr:7-cyano-7-deazaguanine synthase QueC [Kerstersia gyiorum]KAB0544103.1 7-cyano-7-deazaguanine synthase QueC [Kerstersia gyiorum]MCP1631845.1 7-cyano-7-deazaguanine synthase [Kerstersia gyiorum]MCP1637872.1 7-cyano-7-deazaguanine synthase [Kerstersia gyiorum]MCP1672078.1 7-cyano-7-deazaguanine synthase [Kerstersia gyiorum]MCP1677561.1 7-cyano-7-deazaguanine synthase [Kerstersia gyiorum]